MMCNETGTTEHVHIRERPLHIIAKPTRIAELYVIPCLNLQIAPAHHLVVLIRAHCPTQPPKLKPSSHTIQRIVLRTFHDSERLQRTNTNRWITFIYVFDETRRRQNSHNRQIVKLSERTIVSNSQPRES